MFKLTTSMPKPQGPIFANGNLRKIKLFEAQSICPLK